MSIAYDCLMREINTREVYTEERNEREMIKILTCRTKLYTAIESLPNYDELMDENACYKATGNLYSAKGLKFFEGSIKQLALAYEKSKERYITNNLGIIIDQIKFKSHDDYMDRFQEASIYFQRSFNTYDDSQTKFITYAYNYVKFGILNSYKKDDMISIRDGVRFTINRIKELRTKLAPRVTTLEDIKKEYPEFSYEDINIALSYEQSMVSLNQQASVGIDANDELQDFIVDEDNQDVEKEIDDELLTRKVKQVISNTRSFSERDRKILTMRFGIELPDEYTLDEVGKQFGITKERVRQLESKALTILKNRYSIELKEFY